MCLLLAILKHGNSISTTFCNSSSCFSFLPFSSMAIASGRLSAPAPLDTSTTCCFAFSVMTYQQHERCQHSKVSLTNKQTLCDSSKKKGPHDWQQDATRQDATRQSTRSLAQNETTITHRINVNRVQPHETKTCLCWRLLVEVHNRTRLAVSLAQSLPRSLAHARSQCRRSNV